MTEKTRCAADFCALRPASALSPVTRARLAGDAAYATTILTIEQGRGCDDEKLVRAAVSALRVYRTAIAAINLGRR